MLIEGNTIDEVMYQIFTELTSNGQEISSNSRTFIELIGTSIRLKNPRSRLSRSESRGKSVSTIGEFLWHMSGEGEKAFISHYIPNYPDFDKHLIGAYGPRLFNLHDSYDQVSSIIELLRQNETTRNAVIQIFDAKDLAKNSKGTCTLNLQFINRNNKLTLITTMRSNDAYLGLPHDIYSFTMLQELVASELEIEVGDYIHNVGSLHLYDHKIEAANTYLDEGIQATKSMPKMPGGPSMEKIRWLLEIENKIRGGEITEVDDSWEVEDYWKDLVRLLLVIVFARAEQNDECSEIHDSFHDVFYKPYVMDMINRMS